MNEFKTQVIADGAAIKFDFGFAIPDTRKVDVYVQQGASADETLDLVQRSDYTLSFNNQGVSKGYITFTQAPAKDKVVTITPDSETLISFVYSNSLKFNADNLNESFSETSATNSYQLANFLDASLRYNLNEQDSLLTYSNIIPILQDKAFWRRIGDKITAQDYDLFVEEVAGDLKEDITEQVNASANNANLAADIASKPFGQDYSGDVKTIAPDGSVIKTPITPGKSALSGAESAKQWSSETGEFTDAYGNTGFSAKHYSAQAQTAASSAGGVITELYVKSPNPVTKVDLIDYSVTPNEPWADVLENSFTVYVDGLKLPEPTSYSDGSVTPEKPYTVTIIASPTLQNPSYITFNPAIAADKEIIIARSEAQGNSATMFVDSSNAVFIASSKVAERTLSNVPSLNFEFKKLIIDLTYPVGSLFLDGNGTLTPPGQGDAGVTWQEVTEAQGHILMGHSSAGDWAVDPGFRAGERQFTDDYTLNFENLPNSDGINSIEYSLPQRPGTDFGGSNNGGATPQNNPFSMNLKSIQRYGVKIWKRIS